MITITRRFTFSAAHKLAVSNMTFEQNERIYGKCANENFHGHNYILEVTITGQIDQQTGMIIDLNKLKDIIGSEVIENLDHKNLNLDVDWLSSTITTLENLGKIIFNRISGLLIKSGYKLHSIKLQETENNWCIITGE